MLKLWIINWKIEKFIKYVETFFSEYKQNSVNEVDSRYSKSQIWNDKLPKQLISTEASYDVTAGP